MPIFAVPIVTTSSAPQSRVRFSSLPVRNKRKRTISPTPSLSDNDDDAKSQHSRSEAAASTNPLSLTPAEVVQYRLAGLELDERVPTTKGWPHRGLSSDQLHVGRRDVRADIKGKGKEVEKNDETDDEDIKSEEDADDREAEVDEKRMKDQRPPKLRAQHLAVLTAILQRCLLEGDIPRASRAWSMLVRVQVGGHAMDLRASGYWAIGAELLIRSDEKPPSRKQRRESDASSDKENEDGREPETESEQQGARRYGTPAGLEKAKDYYEKLILQYPYSRQWKESVSALDFWPAMVGCEIYGIKNEHKESLLKVATAEENEDENEDALSSPSGSELEFDGAENDLYAVEERRKRRRRQRRTEKWWLERDEIRQTALVAYEKLAARLDELLTTLPFSDSHTMLRLRAMLALCVGDIRVPEFSPDDEETEEDQDDHERESRRDLDGKDTERRLLLRQRALEHKRAKKKQREEHMRARKLFERIERTSGKGEAVAGSLPQEEDEAYES